MKNQTAYILCALALCVSPAFGQTRQEIENKFGKPTQIYSVDDHIWMSPEFTSDGQVCQMTLYPKRVLERSTYLGGLPAWELKRTLDKIAPSSERGMELLGGLTWVGGVATTINAYENINIVSLSPFHVEYIKLSKEPSTTEQKDESVDIDLQVKKKGRPSIDLPDIDPPEVVVITWKRRKCSDQ